MRLILNDFSHTSMRMLYIAKNSPDIIYEEDSKKILTSSFIKDYKFLLLKSLNALMGKFPNSEMILVVDSRPNWRVDFNNKYKINRVKGRKESDINFDTFLRMFQEVVFPIP